jgi:hypothetical protein
MSRVPEAAWAGVLAHVIDTAHLATGDQLSAMVDDAVQPLGLTAAVMMVDLAQQEFTLLQTEPRVLIPVVGTMPGRAYQLGEILAATNEHGAPAVGARAGRYRSGRGDERRPRRTCRR